MLSVDQQLAVLQLLQRGASPAGAMQQLGLSVDVFLRTALKDSDFHERTIEVTDVLSGNVKAVLYRTAMEGNVSAQQAWLKLFPSRIDNREPPTPATFDEILETLSDDQLVELARAMGVDLPHEIKDHP
ncbi:hypothetical protein [Thalassoroseus pseudoceratinae]|uniref:hypothetical protein n=1 Tax=Thalassoroseus pseudoceratinae TaxID=2713176 RepID=UPI00141E199D|nr:hypothetical protein [Thalassoroseus pseudoceratinae]